MFCLRFGCTYIHTLCVVSRNCWILLSHVNNNFLCFRLETNCDVKESAFFLTLSIGRNWFEPESFRFYGVTDLGRNFEYAITTSIMNNLPI